MLTFWFIRWAYYNLFIKCYYDNLKSGIVICIRYDLKSLYNRHFPRRRYNSIILCIYVPTSIHNIQIGTISQIHHIQLYTKIISIPTFIVINNDFHAWSTTPLLYALLIAVCFLSVWFLIHFCYYSNTAFWNPSTEHLSINVRNCNYYHPPMSYDDESNEMIAWWSISVRSMSAIVSKMCRVVGGEWM